MRRVLVLVMACSLVAAPAASGQASTPGSGGFIETPLVRVSLNRDQVSTRLGESFDFTSEISYDGRASLSGWVAHLNVVGLSSGIYVDPEDWSEERTKDVPALGPGESTELSWNVKAVTGGEAAIYVVVLPREAGGPPFVSPTIDVRIAETKDLNSGGVLPLALGVPALLGLAAIVVRRRRR